jgi:thymidine kinase
MNLLAVAHNYKQQGKGVLIMKPSLDTRFGAQEVKSRAGLSQPADVLIHRDTNILDLPEAQRRDINCILVDEVQFLEPSQIDQLRAITLLWKVPVICYGLRTDFRTNLFPGSKRLLELADAIEEVKTVCQYCNSKAVFNLKHVNGKADCTGPAVQLGAEEKYFPACFSCYKRALQVAGQPVSAWEDVFEKRSPPSSPSLDDSTASEGSSLEDSHESL